MSAFLRKLLINTGIGLVLAGAVILNQGVFSVSGADVIRIVCDGFFVAGVLMLAAGLLKWISNEGGMDGLNYALKVGVARIKRDYEGSRKSFADYREEREKKATSPLPLILSGVIHLAIAMAFLALYNS